MSATFNGSSVTIDRAGALKGVTNSKKGTLATWIKPGTDTGDFQRIVHGGVAGSGVANFRFSINTSGKLQVVGLSTSGTTLLNLITTPTYFDQSDFLQVSISWDLGNSKSHFFVNGSSVALDTDNTTDAVIDYETATYWALGYDSQGAKHFNGTLYDLVFWPGVYLDLTDEDTLMLLVADDSATDRLHTSPAGVKPVGYGREGRNLAFPAALLFSDSFQRNFGTGGKFTASTVFDEDDAADASSSPNPFRLFPRWNTPGERWYLSEQSGIPYPRFQTVVEQREGLNSFGKRIGNDEVDDRTRRERPGMLFSDLILGLDEDDSEDDYLR